MGRRNVEACREYRAEKIRLGLCFRCLEPVVPGRKMCGKHQEETNAYRVAWTKKNRPKVAKYQRTWRQKRKERMEGAQQGSQPSVAGGDKGGGALP